MDSQHITWKEIFSFIKQRWHVSQKTISQLMRYSPSKLSRKPINLDAKCFFDVCFKLTKNAKDDGLDSIAYKNGENEIQLLDDLKVFLRDNECNQEVEYIEQNIMKKQYAVIMMHILNRANTQPYQRDKLQTTGSVTSKPTAVVKVTRSDKPTDQMRGIFEQAIADNNIAYHIRNINNYLCGYGKVFSYGDCTEFYNAIKSKFFDEFGENKDEDVYKDIINFTDFLMTYTHSLGMVEPIPGRYLQPEDNKIDRSSISVRYGKLWMNHESYDEVFSTINAEKAKIEDALSKERVMTLEDNVEEELGTDTATGCGANSCSILEDNLIKLQFIETVFASHKEICYLFEKICDGKMLLVH